MRRAGHGWRAIGAALVRLITCLVLVCGAQVVQPRVVPPGNVWSLGDTAASAAVLFGAWWAGTRYYGALLFMTYGMLGGALAGTVFLPDSRDYIGMSMGRSSLGKYISEFCAFAVIMGLTCRAVGRYSHERCEWRKQLRIGAHPICASCGYDLTGNMSGVCPECGASA